MNGMFKKFCMFILFWTVFQVTEDMYLCWPQFYMFHEKFAKRMYFLYYLSVEIGLLQ